MKSWAGHIVGGEIFYTYLGGSSYQVTLYMYKDCDPIGEWAGFDNPLPLAVYNSSNQLVQNVYINLSSQDNVPITFNNPCVDPPNDLCVLRGIYTTTLNLPPNPGGYTLAYQRCCRRPSITNINAPGDTGFTLTCKIPGSVDNNHQNNSAVFNAPPPQVLCNNDQLVFDHSATDPDGDVLVYSLVSPLDGGNPPPFAAPDPAEPPSYFPMSWFAGFSATNPLGPGASISINPNTGFLTADPNLTGLFVVGIRVDEYRNGVLINSAIRDFTYRVFNCNITMQAILPTQEEMGEFAGYCVGDYQINFDNNSFGGTNYQWDFGDPASTTDNSTLFEPSYTYGDTGHYVVRLVVNPGWNCTDTAYMDIYLYEELNVSYTAIDSICFIDNEIDFITTTDAPNGAAFSWDFGINGVPATSEQMNPQNIHFSADGWNHVEVTATYAVCEATYADSVYIMPEPVADFEMPFNYECEGLTVDFINNTENATTYAWDFGYNNETSNEFEPSFTFPAGGTYIVELITSSNAVCQDTMYQEVNVNELLVIDYTQSEDQCITGNSFDFIGTVAGPNHAIYTWSFGPNASITSSNDTSVYNVEFFNTGAQTVSLTGSFDNCTTQKVTEIYIYSQPTIGFTIIDELQCAPYTASFVDLSWSETPIYYNWDFGDGGTSTLQNPTHVFENPGSYPITLTIHTDEGCIDTLTMIQSDIVTVFPTPQASFTVDPSETDICHPLVNFTNTSIDGTKYYYKFDDKQAFSMEENPFHNYSTDGYHYPILIVRNEEGCADTAMMKVYVEPFSVYIPNTFTPNKDLYNQVFIPEMWLTPSEWDFKIYDRWGEIVFETTDYEEAWDGTYKGVPAKTDTYLYTLRYKPCTSDYHVVELNGFVNLLR